MEYRYFEIYFSIHVESPSSEKITSYSGSKSNCECLNYDEFQSVRVICNAFIDNYSPSYTSLLIVLSFVFKLSVLHSLLYYRQRKCRGTDVEPNQ